jgi:hypothetical protein
VKPTQMSFRLLVIAELDKDDVGGVCHPGCREPSEPLPARQVSSWGGPHSVHELGAVVLSSGASLFSPPCHPRAISSGYERYSSGQPRSIGEGCRAGRSPLTWETEAARNFHHLPEIHSERPVFDLRHGLDHPETGSHTDPQTAPERG